MSYGITIRIDGERACFTRSELKSERVSYDVITPSAARGILDAVYWKPAIRWRIDTIRVLNAVRTGTLRRNEVAEKCSYQNMKAACEHDKPTAISATKHRVQRSMLYLRDVSYIVTAHFDLTEKAGPTDTPEKHYNIALRRLRNGQHFAQPYLGCREFPAKVTLLEDDANIQGYYDDVEEKDFGYTLYDMFVDYTDEPTPTYYRAIMHNGIIDVARARGEVVS